MKSLSTLPLTTRQKQYMLYKIYFDSARVAMRAFDRNYLPRYRQMIPEHYETFLHHLEGMDVESVLQMLYSAMVKTAEEVGICTEEALEAAAREDSEISALITEQQKKFQQV